LSTIQELHDRADDFLKRSPNDLPVAVGEAAGVGRLEGLGPSFAIREFSVFVPGHQRHALELARRFMELANARPGNDGLEAVLQEADLIDEDHPDLMTEQRRHLIGLTERGHADIRVLPIGRTGFFRGMKGGFTLLEFDLPEILADHADEKEEAAIVYLEAHAGGRYIEKEPMLTEYRDMFTELESRSKSIKEYSA